MLVAGTAAGPASATTGGTEGLTVGAVAGGGLTTTVPGVDGAITWSGSAGCAPAAAMVEAAVIGGPDVAAVPVAPIGATVGADGGAAPRPEPAEPTRSATRSAAHDAITSPPATERRFTAVNGPGLRRRGAPGSAVRPSEPGTTAPPTRSRELVARGRRERDGRLVGTDEVDGKLVGCATDEPSEHAVVDDEHVRDAAGGETSREAGRQGRGSHPIVRGRRFLCGVPSRNPEQTGRTRRPTEIRGRGNRGVAETRRDGHPRDTELDAGTNDDVTQLVVVEERVFNGLAQHEARDDHCSLRRRREHDLRRNADDRPPVPDRLPGRELERGANERHAGHERYRSRCQQVECPLGVAPANDASTDRMPFARVEAAFELHTPTIAPRRDGSSASPRRSGDVRAMTARRQRDGRSAVTRPQPSCITLLSCTARAASAAARTARNAPRARRSA